MYIEKYVINYFLGLKDYDKPPLVHTGVSPSLPPAHNHQQHPHPTSFNSIQNHHLNPTSQEPFNSHNQNFNFQPRAYNFGPESPDFNSQSLHFDQQQEKFNPPRFQNFNSQQLSSNPQNLQLNTQFQSFNQGAENLNSLFRQINTNPKSHISNLQPNHQPSNLQAQQFNPHPQPFNPNHQPQSFNPSPQPQPLNPNHQQPFNPNPTALPIHLPNNPQPFNPFDLNTFPGPHHPILNPILQKQPRVEIGPSPRPSSDHNIAQPPPMDPHNPPLPVKNLESRDSEFKSFLGKA